MYKSNYEQILKMYELQYYTTKNKIISKEDLYKQQANSAILGEKKVMIN